MSRLRCNSKAVKIQVWTHIRDFYFSDADLLRDMHSGNAGKPLGFPVTLYAQGKYLAESGCFLCYTNDQRSFLKSALGETDEEANRYKDYDVFALYCHLIGVGCQEIIEGRASR